MNRVCRPKIHFDKLRKLRSPHTAWFDSTGGQEDKEDGTQLSFASRDFAGKKKRTKREVFSGRDGGGGAVVGAGSDHRADLSEGWPAGRSAPFSIAVMLRIDCLQQWYSLSDPGAEEALSTSNRCVRSVISNLAATRSPTRRRF